jgi:hypothetical protein
MTSVFLTERQGNAFNRSGRNGTQIAGNSVKILFELLTTTEKRCWQIAVNGWAKTRSCLKA